MRLLLTIAMVLLVLGCGAKPDDDAKPDGGTDAALTPVEVVKAERGLVRDGIDGTATVEARNRATVRARATGTVTELNVEEGATVTANQRLARIDRPTFAGTLTKARAVLNKAKSDLASAKEQHAQGLVPKQSVRDIDFEVGQAKSEVERLRAERGLARVVAPLAGIVVTRHVQPGEAVSMGEPLFELADPAELEAHLRVPERHLLRLREGLPVEVSAEGLGDARVDGTVSRIAPTVDPRSGTVKVVVALGAGTVKSAAGAAEGRALTLRPGMYVRARLIVDTHPDAVLIPKRAVVYDEDRPYAFHVKSGVAEKIALKLGYSDRDNVEVLEPVQAGDELVVFGHRGLESGAKVKVVDQPSEGDAQPTASAADGGVGAL